MFKTHHKYLLFTEIDASVFTNTRSITSVNYKYLNKFLTHVLNKFFFDIFMTFFRMKTNTLMTGIVIRLKSKKQNS